MAEPFLGELRLVPYEFAPQGWAFANGQVLPINQNTAIFSLIGTIYGGDGVSTFALPDLRGRVPVSSGQGPGLSPYILGETLGTESESLTLAQIPAHTHGVNANTGKANQSNPIGHYPATDAAGVAAEYSASFSGQMNANMIAAAGGGQPHDNRQPILVLNWIIALQGIYPARS
jgi:microcystin-dependent protein